MKKTIMYIHGYGSSPQGSTATKIKKTFGKQYNVVCPAVSADPLKSLETINKAIEETKPMVIVGSSMGGLYALASKSGKTPIVLFNPLLKPVEIIKEHFPEITPEQVSKFATLDVEKLMSEKTGCMSAVCSLNDELLGSTTLEMLRGYKGKLWLKTGADFGHRCSGSAFDKICGFIQSVDEI